MSAAAPASPQSLASASGLLLGTTLGCVGIGALIGWAAGGFGIGVLVGMLVGIPLAVVVVYLVYGRR